MKLLKVTQVTLLSLVITFFSSTSVYAQSTFDDAYQTTASLELVDEYGGIPSCRLDLSSTFTSTMRNADYWTSPSLYDDVMASYDQTVAEDGSQALSLMRLDMGGDIYSQAVLVWSETSGTPLTWHYNSTTTAASVSVYAQYSVGISMDPGCQPIVGVSANVNSTLSNNGDLNNGDSLQIRNFVSYDWDANYPPNYDGQAVENGSSTDEDNDGLSLWREIQQGSLDSSSDTDGDGIDDMKESVWFANRDDIFCDTNASPYVCAYPDPSTKDVYVEVDWMNNTSTSTVFKPSSTQLNLVTAMFANEGINLHFDTGEYGGGNELSNYDGALRRDSVNTIPDFADYKNGGDGITANFDNGRLGVWRYMMYGNLYATPNGTSGSSGWSEVLGDDLFISGGVVSNVSGAADSDRAIANTIAHELGHGLCLSSERAYFEQDAQCVFEGIDNRSGLPPTNDPDTYYNLEDYESVMNYRYQLTNQDDIGSVSYSHGPNSSTDHDDWSAMKGHIGGFNGSHTLYVEFGARNATPMIGKPLSADGLIVAESQ